MYCSVFGPCVFVRVFLPPPNALTLPDPATPHNCMCACVCMYACACQCVCICVCEEEHRVCLCAAPML
jgi:hypothetical protein